MQLICQLFKNLFQNSSRLEGICYDEKNEANFQNYTNIKNIIKNAGKKLEFGNLTNLTSFQIQRRESQNHQTQQDHAHLHQNGDTKGAYLYIIVVICFYSLSVLFLLITNSKFKLSFSKRSLFKCHDDNTYKNDLYELQKKETKETIDLLFQNSSKVSIPVSPKKPLNSKKVLKIPPGGSHLNIGAKESVFINMESTKMVDKDDKMYLETEL
jgi:hypothetical protein